MVQPLGKTSLRGFFIKLNILLPYDLEIKLLGSYSNELKTCVHTKSAPKCLQQKAMAPHSSTLAWKIPWTEGHGVARSRMRLSDFTFTFHFHALEKEMATHSSVLGWRIPGTGEPGGLLSMESHRVRHD